MTLENATKDSSQVPRRKGMAASGKVVNRLTVKQIYQLCNWVEQLQPTFDANTTKQYLASKATQQFGFLVNTHNIETVLETAEIKLPQAPKTDNQRLGIIQRAVERLYKELNVPLPPEWTDL